MLVITGTFQIRRLVQSSRNSIVSIRLLQSFRQPGDWIETDKNPRHGGGKRSVVFLDFGVLEFVKFYLCFSVLTVLKSPKKGVLKLRQVVK